MKPAENSMLTQRESLQLLPSLQVPSWDDLCTPVKRGDPAFAQAVAQIKQRGSSFAYRIAWWVIRCLFRDPTYAKFLSVSYDDVIDIMADQVARNRTYCARLEASSAVDQTLGEAPPISQRTNTQLFRSYNQMPCTHDTAYRRVQQALSFVQPEKPILLLGDDDMVSIELAMAGFQDVTAVDIDARVLQDIEAKAMSENLDIKLLQHDLSHPVPLSLYKDYELVFFDCPYTLDGIALFLDAALEITSRRPGTQFFVCLHLMSLMRTGLPQLQAFLDARGVEICAFAQGFNSYPVPARLKPLIHMINQIVIGSKTLATEAYTFPYFQSDMLLLRKT